MKRLLLASLLGVAAADAAAQCWEAAAARHAVDPMLLYAIADVESSMRADAVHLNKDGSRDIGLMQINSVHLNRLAQRGVTEQSLLDPCVSIQAGAEILADFVRRFGYNWVAVGAYNAGSGTDRHSARMRYARKVWQRYSSLVDGAAAPPS